MAETDFRRVVRQDTVGEVLVSTIYLDFQQLGIPDGEQYYETMVFGGEWDQYQARFASEGDAIVDHMRMLEKVS